MLSTINRTITSPVATAIEVGLIDPDPHQPRRHFDPDNHRELVDSIRSDGLLQPIAVRTVGERFVVVIGERRLRAVTALGWDTITATVLSRDNSQDLLVLQLVENLARADLHPIEEAHAYRRLIDAGMTATEVAGRIGKSKGYVSHKLGLLALPDPIGVYLEAGLLSEGQVRQLARLKGFYGTETTTFTADNMPKADELAGWPDDVVIPASVISLRPLDWPASYHMPDFEGEIARVIARSARALTATIIEKPEQPAWLVPSWWYATMLVSFTGSPAGTVTAAKTFVDRHIDSVTSAMIAVLLHGDDACRWPDGDGWLYLSDLRKAGYSTKKEAVAQWFVDHPELVHERLGDEENEGTGIAAPSARQPGGPQSKETDR